MTQCKATHIRHEKTAYKEFNGNFQRRANEWIGMGVV